MGLSVGGQAAYLTAFVTFLEASRDGGCGGLCICVFLVLAGSVSSQINRKKEENMWRVANKMMYRYLFVL